MESYLVPTVVILYIASVIFFTKKSYMKDL